jgi:intracellular multiplication protein IcmO
VLKVLKAIGAGPVGGRLETVALLVIFLSLLSVIPPVSTFTARWAVDIPTFWPTFSPLAVTRGNLHLLFRPIFDLCLALAVGYAAYRLGYSVLREDRLKFVMKSSSSLESSDLNAEPMKKGGLMFGFTSDTGEGLFITDDDLCRHSLIVGQTGVGKTVFLKYLIFQQINRGGGLLFVDGKLDEDNIRDVYEFSAYFGRSSDFLVINPGQPHLSNTYNPILFGDPDEIASRILSLIPSTANSAGADHYKQSANLALVCFISALQEQTREEVEAYREELKSRGLPETYEDRSRVAGKAYNFMDLALLTMNEGVLSELMRHIRAADPNSLSRKNLSIFLDQYSKENGIDGDLNEIQVDLKRLKETLGGIGARMHQFGSGNFGPVLNSYSPEVKIYDAIRDNKIVYVALPTMGKDVAAQNLGKIIISDLRTAISWLQLNKNDRPEIPFLAVMDEMNSYATESLAVMFEQARSARVALMPAIQTDSGLSNISVDFKERILANTENKIFFRLSSQDTATMGSDLIGETKRVAFSESAAESTGQSAQALQLGPNKNASASSSSTSGEREQVEPLVSPDTLKALGRGECLVLRHPKVWNIRVPFIGLTKETRAAIGPLRINRSRKNLDVNKTFNALGEVDRHLEAAQMRRLKAASKKDKKNGAPHQATQRPDTQAELFSGASTTADDPTDQD